MSRSRLILIVACAAGLASGCAKVQARTEPVMPELMPPPPPPRIVETYTDDLAAPGEPANTESSTPAARNTAKPPATPAPIAKPEPAKPEPAVRTETERPAPQPPALTLKPAPGSQSTTEASIRSLISNASRDLSRVNYGVLNQDGKAQYDMAKRFMQQADDALRGGNLVFAGKLADKAATMAAVLVR